MTAGSSILLAVLGFASDRVTKDIVENRFSDKELKICSGKIKIKSAVNRGFAMNTMDSNRSLVVTVSSVVFLFIMTYYAIVLTGAKLAPLRLGFGILMAGAAGNLYDRVVKGYVVDFINVPFARKIVFNLADAYILVGALLTLAGEITTTLKK